MKPFDRPVAAAVRAALKDTPVVCLLGPRQSGKSTLARTLEPRYTYVTFDDAPTLAFALSDPVGFIAALPDPVVLDEVQRVPELLRTIKMSVDRDRRPGRFLLTGSANLLPLPRLGDSLAGRMEVVQLHPLTAAEQARTKGRFLSDLLSARIRAQVAAASHGPLPLAERVVKGGFPEAVSRPVTRARAWHREYLRTIIERDVKDVAQVRDAAAFGRLIEMLALRSAELLNISSLGNDLDLRRETVESYIGVCERMFLVRRLLPWHRNDAKRLIKTPKVHIVDSGIAATLAGVRPEDWSVRRERFGALLESFVVEQFVAQAGWTDPDLRFWHYRDKDQVEVDLVITRGRETWGVEVKAAATATTADGRGLRRLAERCGQDYRGGVLLHAGDATLPLDDSANFAVPLSRLWDR